MKRYKTVNKKNIISLVAVLVFSVAIIGLTIGFASTANSSENVDAPALEVTKPTVQESFSAPASEYTVLKDASIDKLVYMSSLNMWKTHNGIDLAMEQDSVVKSVYSGKVKRVEQSTLEGVIVTVDLNNGMTAIYKSLSSASVKDGDKVENGSVIGVVGTMLSENDEGVHLHLELKKDGSYVNPADYIDFMNGNK